MPSLRSQTSVEYLIIIGIGVLIVLVAAAAFFQVTNAMIEEYNAFVGFEGNVTEVITG